MDREKTVIEIARKQAGLSQTRLARIARTQQSSVSEYESRRKSPTLDVVERLVDAADAELWVRPIALFDYVDLPDGTSFALPDRLWTVPLPLCFAPVQVLHNIFHINDDRIFDLSDPDQRIAYYELVLVHGLDHMILDSVDGVLLCQAWPHMTLPDPIREAWQPLIDAATAPQDVAPRDPAGVSAAIAGRVGYKWPPPRPRTRKPREPQRPIPRVSRDSPVSIWRRYSSSTD